MIIRILGAICVVCGCGSFGFAMAAAYIKREKCLRQLLLGLETMGCEMTDKLTPLPALCQMLAGRLTGPVGRVFAGLGAAMLSEQAPDVNTCMHVALATVPELPRDVAALLVRLAANLGQYNLDSEVRGVEAVRASCAAEIQSLAQGKEGRLRSYKTLGLCAGAALAILLL